MDTYPHHAKVPNHDPGTDSGPTYESDGASIDGSALDLVVLFLVCIVAVYLAWRFAQVVYPRCRKPEQPEPDSTSTGFPFRL